MSKVGIVNALRARYEADIAEADATINIYLENSVGIGEHPQHVQEVDKLLGKIGHAKKKLEQLAKIQAKSLVKRRWVFEKVSQTLIPFFEIPPSFETLLSPLL